MAKAGSSFSFFPFYGAMNGKERKDYERDSDCRRTDGSLIQRRMSVNLAAAMVHVGPDHVDEETLGEMIDAGSMDPIVGFDGVDLGVMNHAQVSVFDGSGDYTSRGSFGVPYCNYLMFNAAGAPGSNDLMVSQSTDTVRVQTQPGLDNNVGLCAYDTSGEEPLVIFLHLDIAYDVINQ